MYVKKINLSIIIPFVIYISMFLNWFQSEYSNSTGLSMVMDIMTKSKYALILKPDFQDYIFVLIPLFSLVILFMNLFKSLNNITPIFSFIWSILSILYLTFGILVEEVLFTNRTIHEVGLGFYVAYIGSWLLFINSMKFIRKNLFNVIFRITSLILILLGFFMPIIELHNMASSYVFNVSQILSSTSDFKFFLYFNFLILILNLLLFTIRKTKPLEILNVILNVFISMFYFFFVLYVLEIDLFKFPRIGMIFMMFGNAILLITVSKNKQVSS